MMRAACMAALALALAGCGLYGGGPLGEGAPGVIRAGGPPPAQALAAVRPGASTKAEVAAALGSANVITFDSGYEVWVYRWLGADRTPRGATELVILFDRGGVARKARVRPGQAA